MRAELELAVLELVAAVVDELAAVLVVALVVVELVVVLLVLERLLVARCIPCYKESARRKAEHLQHQCAGGNCSW